MLTFTQLLTEANLDKTWEIYGDRVSRRLAFDESNDWLYRDEDQNNAMHDWSKNNIPGYTGAEFDERLPGPPFLDQIKQIRDAVRTGQHTRETVPIHPSLHQLHKQTFINTLTNLGDDPNDSVLRHYAPWISNQYIKGNIKRWEDVGSSVQDTLEKFHAIKSKPSIAKQYGIHRDINQYNWEHVHAHTPEEWNSMSQDERRASIDRANKNLFHALLKVPHHALLPDVQPHEYTKIDEPHWTIITPHTKNAACKYGAGTQWCTAARNYNMFDHYNRQNPMAIFIPKVPEHPGEKYQLHIGQPSRRNTTWDRSIRISAPEVQFADERDNMIHPANAGLTGSFDSSSHPVPMQPHHYDRATRPSQFFKDYVNTHYRDVVQELVNKHPKDVDFDY